jgi:hypothetical protein
MNFEAMTQKEIDDNRLLPKGDYDFEVIDAWETRSSAGNDMIELQVRISANGHSRTLADYLLAQRPEKLLHCTQACGIEDRYNAGQVADNDFKGKRGRLRLGVERARQGYPPRNVIADYIVPKA